MNRQKAESRKQKAVRTELLFCCLLLSAYCFLFFFIPHPSSLIPALA